MASRARQTVLALCGAVALGIVFLGCPAAGGGGGDDSGAADGGEADPGTEGPQDGTDPTEWGGLLMPANGAADIGTSVTLSWESDPAATQYLVTLDTLNPPMASAGTVSTNSIDPGDLDLFTTYYWNVTSIRADGSQTSETRSFYTGAVAVAYYVAPSGDDGNPGTQSEPVQTVLGAVALAGMDPRPILVAAGTYDSGSSRLDLGNDEQLYGGFESTNWTRDVAANETILVASDNASTITANSASVVDGFTIRTYPEGGSPAFNPEFAISTSGGSPTVRNNLIIGGAATGTNQSRTVHVQGNGTMLLEDNVIIGSDVAWDSTAAAISLASGGAVTLRRNVVDSGFAADARTRYGILGFNGSVVSEENTYILRGAAGGGQGYAIFHQGGVTTGTISSTRDRFVLDDPTGPANNSIIFAVVPTTVVNSVFDLNAGTGAIYAFNNNVNSTDLVVANNTFVIRSNTNLSNQQGILAAGTNFTIVNNIVHFTATGSGNPTILPSTANLPDLRGNFFYSSEEDLSGSIDPDDITSTDADFVRFADRSGGDFRLTASTPAAITEGGVDASSLGVSEDFAGSGRTAPYSIGAFER